MKTRRFDLILAAALSSAAFAPSAFAARIYKDAATTDLNDVANWATTSGGATDPSSIGSTDALRFNEVFAPTSGINYTAALSADLAVGGIELDSGSVSGGAATGNVIISAGNTLTLNGASLADINYTAGGIVLNSSAGGTLNIDANVAIGASQQWVTSRALTVTGGINLNANTLSFNTAGASNIMTLSGVISGTGSLNKTAGPGTLTLANTDNSFSGTVTLVGGNTNIAKLAIGGADSSLGKGSGNIVLNGANLVYTGTGAGTTDRAIEMRAGAGVLNNSASDAITFTATHVIQSGTASARTLTLNGSNTGDNTFNAILGDSGASPGISRLQKSGAGKWIATGAHTYTGATVINQGTLVVNGSAALGGASGSTADEGNIWFSSVQANGALHFETVANLGPADQVRFRNTGGTTGNGGALVYMGTTDQTLSKTFQCDSSIGIRLESNSVGGKLTYNGAFSQTNRALYLGGSGTGDNTLATAFTGNGGITKRDAGKWVLTGTHTYTGNTVVNDGTLAIDASGSLRFRPTTNGTSNSVSGSATATLTFTGTVSLDLGAAAAIAGNSWTLFNLGSFTGPVPTLAPAAVTSTTLGAFTQTSPGIWELPVTGAKWRFTTADGKLAYTIDYSSWAAANAPGQTINQDHDNDGVSNGVEYFMGQSGTGFTALPGIANNLGTLSVTWIKAAGYTGTYGTHFEVETSATLTSPWTPAAEGTGADKVEISGNNVTYTFPTGTRNFARLKITGP